MKLELVLREESNPAEARNYEFELNGTPVVLGRGPESPVPLEGTRISRQHLSFVVMQDTLTVTDVSSTGVWVNDQPVRKNTPVGLKPSDQIKIPGYTIVAAIKQPPPPAPAAQAATQVISVPDALKQPAAPAGPAWWRLDGLEKWALLFIVASAMFLWFYRWF